MHKIIDCLALATKIAAGVSLGAMTIMVGIVILGRYINLSVAWADELARIFFIWSAFLGAASATHNRMHFSVSFFTSYFRQSIRWILSIATGIMIAAIALFILVAAYSVLEVAQIQILPALQISKFWIHLSVIFSCFLIFLFIINQLILELSKNQE